LTGAESKTPAAPGPDAARSAGPSITAATDKATTTIATGSNSREFPLLFIQISLLQLVGIGDSHLAY
jgi:hypothetical protein